MAEKSKNRTYRRRATFKKYDSFKRLKELKCFEDVKQRVVQGYQLTKIADFIQQDCGEYADVTRDSLCKTLRKFRDNELKGDMIAQHMPAQMDQLVQEAEEAVDEVQELARLYKIQMDRIEREAKLEKEIGKLFKTLGNEVFYAMKILQTSAGIKADYGLVPGAKPNNQVNLQFNQNNYNGTHGSAAVESVMKDPASRQKVISLVERLSKMTEKEQKALAQENEQTGLPKKKVQEVIEAELKEEVEST